MSEPISSIEDPRIVRFVQSHDCADCRLMPDGRLRIASYATTWVDGQPVDITCLDFASSVAEVKAILGY